MADTTKCNSPDCSKRFDCGRYTPPSTPGEAMQKYERHHPEAPWLCFVVRVKFTFNGDEIYDPA